jgi:hypothetical protein
MDYDPGRRQPVSFTTLVMFYLLGMIGEVFVVLVQVRSTPFDSPLDKLYITQLPTHTLYTSYGKWTQRRDSQFRTWQ